LHLQPGLKEKFSLLDHFQSVITEAEEHTGALHSLTAKSRELYERTRDESFQESAQEELRTQLHDITTVAKVSALNPRKRFKAQVD
jgi:nesprin-1